MPPQNALALRYPRKVVRRTVFPLLKLPVEVRMMIYEVHFGGHKIRIKHGGKGYDLESSIYGQVIREGNQLVSFLGNTGLSILLVSRQVYKEALDVLFGSNTFVFSGMSVLQKFCNLANVGIANIKTVEIIRLYRSSRASHFSLVESLKKAKKLKSITIFIDPQECGSLGPRIRKLVDAELRSGRRALWNKLSFQFRYNGKDTSYGIQGMDLPDDASKYPPADMTILLKAKLLEEIREVFKGC